MPLYLLQFPINPSSIQSQSHIVTLAEQGSGIVIGLSSINSLVKVEDVNGTVVKFTLTTPTSITVVPPQILSEDDVLIIWYK